MSETAAAKEIGGWIGESPIRLLEYKRNGIPIPGDPMEQQRIEIIGEQLIRIRDTRQQMFFGLGAWIVHLFDREEFGNEDFRQYMTVISTEFTEMPSFYDIYISITMEIRSEDIFGWDWWELKGRPETHGQVIAQPLMFRKWLGMYYVLRALEMAPNDPAGIPDLHPSIASKGVFDSVVENLDTLAMNLRWQGVLEEWFPGNNAGKKASLIRMHEQAADQQRIVEEDLLIEQGLNEDIIVTFKQDVESTWLESSTLRNLVKRFGNYEEKSGSK